MSRLPFTVEVEGIGTFTFKHAAIIEQIGIETRQHRILGGPCDNEELSGWALMVARLDVLTEKAPEGWDLLAMDFDDPETVPKLLLVHRRLREEQLRFREEAAPRRIQPRKADEPNPGVPVSAPVQSAADGSAVS